MKVSTEIDNNFGYEKITQLVDNIPLIHIKKYVSSTLFNIVIRNLKLSPLLKLSFEVNNYLPCLTLNPTEGLKGT